MYTSSLKNFEELRRKHTELWLKSSTYLARVEKELKFGPDKLSPSPKKRNTEQQFDFQEENPEGSRSPTSKQIRSSRLLNQLSGSSGDRFGRQLSFNSPKRQPDQSADTEGDLGKTLPKSVIKLSKASLFSPFQKLDLDERSKRILNTPQLKRRQDDLTDTVISSSLQKIERKQATTDTSVSQRRARIKRAVDPREKPLGSALHVKTTNDWFRSRMGRTVQTKYLYLPEEIKKRQQMMEIFDNFDEDGNAKLELDEFLGMFVSTYLHGKNAEISSTWKPEKLEKLDKSESLDKSEKNAKPFPSSPKTPGKLLENSRSDHNSISKFTKDDGGSEVDNLANVHFRATKNIRVEERIPSASLPIFEDFLLPRFQQFYQFVTKKDYLTKEEFILLAFDPQANEHFQETMKLLAHMVKESGKRPEREIPYTFSKMIGYLGYSSRRDYLYKKFLKSRDHDYLDASNHLEDILFLKSDQIKQEYDSNEKLRKYRMKTTSNVKSKAAMHLEAMGQFLTKLLQRRTNTKEITEVEMEEGTEEAKSETAPVGLKRLVPVDPSYVNQLKIDVKTQKRPQLMLADRTKARIKARIHADLKSAQTSALEEVKKDLHKATQSNSMLVYKLVRSHHLPEGYVKSKTTSFLRPTTNQQGFSSRARNGANNYSLEGYGPTVDRVSTLTDFKNIRVKSSSKVRPPPGPGISEFDEVVHDARSVSIDDNIHMQEEPVKELPKPTGKPKLTKMTTVEFISDLAKPLDPSVHRKDLGSLLRPIEQPRRSTRITDTVASPTPPVDVESSQKPESFPKDSNSKSVFSLLKPTDVSQEKEHKRQFASAFLKAFSLKKD